MFWAALTGRSCRLHALQEVWQRCHVSTSEQSHLSTETRLVPIAQIQGSEGRCGDFDRDFNPLHDRSRERWLRIAAARRCGKPLPPVVLAQVGDLYFVQDGHHRISVARALGQRDIEARVTVWQATGPLPWDAQARSSKALEPKLLLGQLHHGILAYIRKLLPKRKQGTVGAGL
jgi:hypothetical protein